MKTIYISDLDGTLLTPDATLSAYTVQTLRDRISRGLCFTVATARTWEGASHILQEILPLPAPLVLLNGALVFDSLAGRYVHTAVIAPDDVEWLLRRAQAHGQTGFLYSLGNNGIVPYHEPIVRPVYALFQRERQARYGFVETNDLSAHAAENIVYYTIQDERERLVSLHRDIQAMPTLDCTMYMDTYHQDNWFLECFSCRASKKNAVVWLRRRLACEYAVGFGDNLNDLSLFEACNEGYAVANACAQLKAKATGIIAANTEDGVARFLADLPI
jgi:Cof subfamily protein (haloacid dehalogenase superfamily)